MPPPRTGKGTPAMGQSVSQGIAPPTKKDNEHQTPPLLCMDEIPPHFETMANHCLLVLTRQSSETGVSSVVRTDFETIHSMTPKKGHSEPDFFFKKKPAQPPLGSAGLHPPHGSVGFSLSEARGSEEPARRILDTARVSTPPEWSGSVFGTRMSWSVGRQGLVLGCGATQSLNEKYLETTVCHQNRS